MQLFNYIFFRIAQIRFKRDGTTASTAVTLVTLLQTALISFLIMEPICINIFTKKELATHAKQLGWIAGIIFIALLIFNYRKYSGMYYEYENRWRDENTTTKLYRGVLVLIIFIFPILLIIITNNILHKKS